MEVAKQPLHVRVIDWLTKPHPAITDLEGRRKARLLASFTLALLFFRLISINTNQYIDPSGASLPRPYQAIAGVVFLALIYVISRSRYFYVGSGLAVFAIMLGATAPAFTGRLASVNGFYVYILGIMFSGLLLPFRVTLALAVASVVGIRILVTIADGPDSPMLENIANPMLIISSTSILLLVFIHYRNALERDRKAHLVELNEQLRQKEAALAATNATLEQRVIERTHSLEMAKEEAERANRAKTEFLSNMSHELRTPLNMVIGYTSSMLDMPSMYNNVLLPDAYAADIQTIQDSGNHLLSLINDVLDLSKIEAGKMSLNYDAVSLNHVFQGVIATSTGLVGNRPVQVRADYPEDLPFIHGDALRVRQILLNLMSNAVKFTESGSVTLSAQADDDSVLISVRDTGPGIPDKALKALFSRFDQVRSKDGYRGTGLGLEISQQLAHLHGTTIEVSSQVGQGSTFSIHFPIATPEHLTRKKQTDEIQTVNAELFDGGAEPTGIAILITDQLAIRQMARLALTDENYDIVDAETFEIGYEMATALLPDLVLVDLAMVSTDEIITLIHDLRAEAVTAHVSVIALGNPDNAPAEVTTTVSTPLEFDVLKREIGVYNSVSTRIE